MAARKRRDLVPPASPDTAVASLPNAEQIAKALAPMIAEQLRMTLSLGPDALFSAEEASAILRRSPSTLEKWRRDAIGPKAVKAGVRSVAYRLGDLRDFIRDAEAAFPAHTGLHPTI